MHLHIPEASSAVEHIVIPLATFFSSVSEIVGLNISALRRQIGFQVRSLPENHCLRFNGGQLASDSIVHSVVGLLSASVMVPSKSVKKMILGLVFM
jgi:hypothetical protein